jgi:hypothetical protein
MDSLLKLIQRTLFKKSAVCFVFIGLLTTGARAQLGIPPVVTPPIVLPSVLSLGGAATNGGTVIMTATATSVGTAFKGMAWYCGNQPVPAGKCSVSNSNGVAALGTYIVISTLTISGVALTNAGSYSLHATNGAGTTIGGSVSLLVQNLANTVVSTVTNVVSVVADATGMVSTGFQLRLSGLTGSNVVIQASSDLITWTSISTNTFVSGLVNFIDTSAKNRSFRYYRTYAQ